MSKRIVYILLGMPGCGKETFGLLLAERILGKTGTLPFISDTGKLFRASLSNESGAPILNGFHQARIKEIQNSGKLQTSALATIMWGQHFCKNYNNEEYIIIDGSPRRSEEFDVMNQFLKEFYDADIRYIHIIVSDATAVIRMLLRNEKNPRPETSSKELIQVRLDDFKKHNQPVITKIRLSAPASHFLTVSNDGTPDDLKGSTHDYFFKFNEK